MLVSMSEEKIATFRYISETGDEPELVEIDVPAEVAEAIDRGEVVAFRELDHRRFKLKDAADRIQAWHDEIQRG
jgi:hypothetical protein